MKNLKDLENQTTLQKTIRESVPHHNKLKINLRCSRVNCSSMKMKCQALNLLHLTVKHRQPQFLQQARVHPKMPNRRQVQERDFGIKLGNWPPKDEDHGWNTTGCYPTTAVRLPSGSVVTQVIEIYLGRQPQGRQCQHSETKALRGHTGALLPCTHISNFGMQMF